MSVDIFKLIIAIIKAYGIVYLCLFVIVEREREIGGWKEGRKSGFVREIVTVKKGGGDAKLQK